MNDENKSISIALDAETEQLLKDAAALNGMSLEHFCLAAAKAKAELTVLLYGEKSAIAEESPKKAKERWLPIFEQHISPDAAHDPARGQKEVWEVNSEGMVRSRVESSREESVKDLEKLFAECDEITQGRISSTSAADLIREAREERHQGVESQIELISNSGIWAWGGQPFTEESAEKLIALRDEIFQGRVSSTDSVDLIREARKQRGKRQEELGRS